jgi:hypothetical protein
MAGYTIPTEVARSLEMLIEYLWPEESLDYELSSPQDRDRHIFKDVMVVNRWLSELRKSRQNRPLRALRSQWGLLNGR